MLPKKSIPTTFLFVNTLECQADLPSAQARNILRRNRSIDCVSCWEVSLLGLLGGDLHSSGARDWDDGGVSLEGQGGGVSKSNPLVDY